MRMLGLAALLVACGGKDTDSGTTTGATTGAPTGATGTATGAGTGTGSGTGTGTGSGTGGTCFGAAHGEVTATACPSTSCPGDLYIGVFPQNPLSNPGQNPIAATSVYGVDPSASPAAWSIGSIPCGTMYVAPFLDLDGNQVAGPGDLVMATGADQITTTSGGDLQVDQDLDFVIP